MPPEPQEPDLTAVTDTPGAGPGLYPAEALRTLQSRGPDAPSPFVNPKSPEAAAAKEFAVSKMKATSDQLDAYRVSKEGNGLIIEKGKAFRWVEEKKQPPSDLTPAQLTDWYSIPANNAPGKMAQQTDVYATQLLNVYDEYSSQLNDLGGLKSLGSMGGAAASYLSSETGKSKEIDRQYNDFKDRASLYTDLLGAEQTYGMNADDQNYQALKAQKDLGIPSIPWYAQMPMQSSLSSILRPSLPDYVSPDYRLNQAVGLPGPQGFNDPNYDQSGMPNGTPAYAYGTARNAVSLGTSLSPRRMRTLSEELAEPAPKRPFTGRRGEEHKEKARRPGGGTK